MATIDPIRFATVEDADDDPLVRWSASRETVEELHKMKSTTSEDIRRFGFGDDPAFETLIAEIDGRFAGCCLFFPSFSTWIGRPGVYVQDLYVDG